MCKALVARGAPRVVTLAVVCQRPRRLTTFVRHVGCVDAAFAGLVLGAHGDIELVPVVVGGEPEVLERVRASLRQMI